MPNTQLCQVLLVERIMGVPAEVCATVIDPILSRWMTYSQQLYLNYNTRFQKTFLLPAFAMFIRHYKLPFHTEIKQDLENSQGLAPAPKIILS